MRSRHLCELRQANHSCGRDLSTACKSDHHTMGCMSVTSRQSWEESLVCLFPLQRISVQTRLWRLRASWDHVRAAQGRAPQMGPSQGTGHHPTFRLDLGWVPGGRAGSGLSSGSTQAVQRLAAWLPRDQGGPARPGLHVPCEEKGPSWVLVRMNELEEHHGSAWHMTRALGGRWCDLALESGCKASAAMLQLPPGPWAGTRQEAGSSFAGLSVTKALGGTSKTQS